MNQFLVYILENAKVISIREFAIIMILMGTLILNSTNPKLQTPFLRIAYPLACSFVIIMIILYLLQLNIFLYFILIILLAAIGWISYNIKMMNISSVDMDFLNKIKKNGS